MTRMSDGQELARAGVENPLFVAGRMLKEMDLVELRVAQALRRAPALGYLLQPVSETLGNWRGYLSGIHQALGSAWKSGEEKNWR